MALRTRALHHPYGDQGLFVNRHCLQKLDGFREWPLLEDVDMVSRLNSISPPAIVPCDVQTSGRRWRRLGFWRTMLVNQWILLRWRCGASVYTLAQEYYSLDSKRHETSQDVETTHGLSLSGLRGKPWWKQKE